MASIEAVQAALDLFDKMPTWFKELSPTSRKDRAKVYELGLRNLTDRELLTAAEQAIGVCKWFPVPAELNELARPKTAQKASLHAEAEESYGVIVAAFEQGLSWGFAAITARLGRSAARAFLAAGGESIFSWCEPGQEQAFRQKRFIESYLLHAEAEKALEGLQVGTRERESIPSGEAVLLLKKIGEHS